METAFEIDAFDEWEDPCLIREDCVAELLRDSPPGCVYCALDSFDGDE